MEPSGPLVEIAIAAAELRDRPRLADAALRRAAAEPSLHVAHCPETGLVILGACGEAELGRAVARLRGVDGIPLHVGAPRVAFRETLTRRVEQEHTTRSRPGGMGPSARVRILVEPEAACAGDPFASRMPSGALPDADLAAVARGIAAVMGAGVLAGHPLAGVNVTLVDAASGEPGGDGASALALEVAARAAFREALQRGGPVLLAPAMRVEVVTPAMHADACIADLEGRGGVIRGGLLRGGEALGHAAAEEETIDATVPLAGLIGYVDRLRALSGGRGRFTMRFDRYVRHAIPSGPDGRDPPLAAMAAACRAA